MKVLITGGAGFIGSSLSEKLLSLGYEVTGVDNFSPYYDPKYKRENVRPLQGNASFTLIEGDIGNPKFLNYIFQKNKFTKVVHLAASVGVRNSLVHPNLYYHNNVQGTKTLLDAVVKHQISQFIFASSSSVYGNISALPFKEDKVADSPLSPYAATKKKAEDVCYTYHKKYNLPITIFRLFTVYGPKGRPDMSPYIFTDAILKGKKLPVFGDGKASRDFTYIDDIVGGVVSGLGNVFLFEIFNLGSSSPIDMLSFIHKIEQITHKKAHIQNLPTFLPEMRNTYAHIQKAGKLLGYKPKISIEKGLEVFIEWFKKHRM